MSVKIISVQSIIAFLSLLLVIAGCTPAGPRALLKGKKNLDAGENAEAVAQLKIATTLLATNAAAWNYYGVALQRAGQPDEAAAAYNRALDLDRELLEARLNLGTLYLEQNQAEPAKAQFTAYTLRRPNDAEGWIKLGTAQLKAGDIVPAERSFSAVLALKTSEAEAYNGLGMARVQRGKPHEAAQFFAAALQAQPDFAPALLNLGIVSQQQLHDNKAALDSYQKYLALTPRPAIWEEVNALAQSVQPAASVPTTVTAVAPVGTAAPASKPAPAVTAETKLPAKLLATSPPKLNLSPRSQSEVRTVPVSSKPAQTIQVAPETQIVATPAAPIETKTAASPPKNPVTATETPLGNPSFVSSGITPLPSAPLTTSTPVIAKPVTIAAAKSAHVILPPAPVNFPRYAYTYPRPPKPGDRQAASAAFTDARTDEKDMKPVAALAAYQKAAQLDPAWFEAQYNAAVLAQRQGDVSTALAGYEKALAIKPDSVDARYNFALALRSAGYSPDAAAELRKILAASPGEIRAHLALANLCAQTLHDPAQARAHYQKVLELDPKNPRASEIQFWLGANPG